MVLVKSSSGPEVDVDVAKVMKRGGRTAMQTRGGTGCRAWEQFLKISKFERNGEN